MDVDEIARLSLGIGPRLAERIPSRHADGDIEAMLVILAANDEWQCSPKDRQLAGGE